MVGSITLQNALILKKCVQQGPGNLNVRMEKLFRNQPVIQMNGNIIPSVFPWNSKRSINHMIIDKPVILNWTLYQDYYNVCHYRTETCKWLEFTEWQSAKNDHLHPTAHMALIIKPLVIKSVKSKFYRNITQAKS